MVDEPPEGRQPQAVSDTANSHEQTKPRLSEEDRCDARVAKLLLDNHKPHEASPIIEKLLLRHPDSAHLTCLRGRCLEQLGNVAGAYACYMSGIALDPCYLQGHLSVAALYKTRGMLVEALESMTKAHNLAPNNQALREELATILTDLGTKLKLEGKVEEGVQRYSAALEVCPNYAVAHYNLGVVCNEKGQLDAAMEWYRKAVVLAPRHAQAHCNIGVLHKEAGNLEAAIQCYEGALAAVPGFTVVQTNLAIALTELGTKVKMEGDSAGGIALYERALAHNPRHADALYNLGVAMAEAGQLDRAIFCYEMTTHFNPACAEAYNNLGVIHKERANLQRAAECYMAALQIRPNFPQSLNNLGVLHTVQGQVQDGLRLLQAAIAAAPGYAEAYNNLGVLQRDVGAIDEAITSYSKCIELCPDSRNAGQNRLLALNYIYPGEDARVCQAHEDWGRDFALRHPQLPAVEADHWDTDPNRPLRVGYVSPDFYTHSVSYFAEAPLRHHRRQEVELYAYSCVAHGDGKTARLRSAVAAAGGTWRDVAAASEVELAAMVAQDHIDILVDLTGHTANNRLGTFAMKPAPIQVTWIGYPNSTGLAQVDYRLTDALCDPPGTSQTFVEELVRLPGCFLCYTPAADAPEVAPLPALSNGYITFGSFNNLAKITQEVVRTWARILAAVPRSRLVLKNKPFACEAARSRHQALLAAEGIEAWRVDLLPLAAANADHLSTYAQMDISLDPWPYAGTTTTCESLLMGVPCVTLCGSCHAHNVGASLMAALGMAEGWVADSTEQYIQLAVAQALDVQKLAEVRAGLRRRMLASPLCDAAAFIPRLEGTYRQLWQRWLDTQKQKQQQECEGGCQAVCIKAELHQHQQPDASARNPEDRRQTQEEEEEDGGNSSEAADTEAPRSLSISDHESDVASDSEGNSSCHDGHSEGESQVSSSQERSTAQDDAWTAL